VILKSNAVSTIECLHCALSLPTLVVINRNKAETEAKKGHAVKMEGEQHGLSVLFQLHDDIFHTYSVYARGCESLSNAYRLLDQTPYGRQQDFEDSPSGWPQKPTYG
jgi:predicted dithiol-disulfide oxidoreductase (DUF899 family)